MNTPTRLAIIGHSNTGKTSLMRTLLRHDDFGEIKNASATTRHVAEVAIYDEDGTRPLLLLSDTPGLEDATGVMDDIADNTSERDDGVLRLRHFLDKVQDNDPAVQAFRQEAKAINALLTADLAIYVIDARLMPTARYKDELAILVLSSVPILPVFNFIKDSQHMAEWQSLLARRGLHVASLFDTVAFDFANEMNLWQNLITLSSTLPNQRHHQAQLSTVKKERKLRWRGLFEDGNLLIADFLVNVASFSKKIGKNTDPMSIIGDMQAKIRQAEKNTMQALLNLYRFYHAPLSVDTPAIALLNSDPFAGRTLSEYGMRTVSGGSVGAMIGAGIDVATLGTSLGLGTVLGGLLGGGLANAGVIKDKLTGTTTLCADDATILLLANRLIALHHTLRHTGHATQDNLGLHPHHAWQSLQPVAKIIQQALQKPHYSSLNTPNLAKNLDKHAILRQDLASALAIKISQSTQDEQDLD